MKVCGIICEYNPFHNGHKYQIDILKQNYGFDAVVCLMSGNYTQCGDIAIFDKNIRTRAALKCGADLVLELPAIHAMQTAEVFARNAVYILSESGIIDYLAFGAEYADTSILKKIAELLAFEPARFKDALKSELDFGKPFFTARAVAVERMLGKSAAEIIAEPNNILAVEYIKSLLRFESGIEPVAVKRVYSEHNDNNISGEISSATAVRDALYSGDDRAYDALPQNLIRLYKNADIHNIENLNAAIISKIMLSNPKNLKDISDIGEGLENKLISAACASHSFFELCENIKSKRYAHSRIRRIVLSAFLDITKKDAATPPQYIKILDFNDTGRELLHRAKKASALALAKNRNSIKNLPSALKIWDRELIFDDIYNLS